MHKSPNTAKRFVGLGPKRPRFPRGLRKSVVAGSAVVLAGAVGFGVDHLVSSSSPPGTHTKRSSPMSKSKGSRSTTTVTPATIPDGLASSYLATSADAVVSIDWTSGARGIAGTATAVAATGNPPDRGEDYVTYSVSASLIGTTLHVGFNGKAQASAHVTNGVFTVDFDLPTGTTEAFTFRPSSTQEIGATQAAFVRSLQPVPSRTTRPNTPKVSTVP